MRRKKFPTYFRTYSLTTDPDKDEAIHEENELFHWSKEKINHFKTRTKCP